MTIHLVEDDVAVRDSLMLLLASMGHRVACYPDGESFVGAAPPAGGDQVLVDLALPGISGAAVIAWLQAFDDPPRIIAMSGQPRPVLSTQLRDVRVACVLRKPLDADAVAASLAG